jgi:4-hydroxyphenylpyruvate dioxygenase
MTTAMPNIITNTMTNQIGLCGLDFIEYTSASSDFYEQLFASFGFSKLAKHQTKNIMYHKQNDIHFFVNSEPKTFAETFGKSHGASICSMGWRFKNPQKAYEMALSKGAKAVTGDYFDINNNPIPAIYGIGDSLIYFVDQNTHQDNYKALQFKPLEKPFVQKDMGFTIIDHLTNNVFNGTMQTWADFYKNIFGFTEVRYFDIRGAQTGLTSYALKSPCGSFCIPKRKKTNHKSMNT